MACGAICLSTPIDFGEQWVDHIPIVANSVQSIIERIELLDSVDQAAMIRAGLATSSAYDWKKIGARWTEILLGEVGKR